MKRITPGAVVAVAVAALFIVRAAAGAVADRAYHRGAVAAADGRYAEAAPGLERGAVGADRDEALWLLGQVHLGLWDALPPKERDGDRGSGVLGRAAAAFLAERAGSPASGWSLNGLGQVYARREAIARTARTFDLDAVTSDPWTLLGDDGRIAVGLERLAIEREPNTFTFRDRLTLLFQSNGLRDAAKDAIRESARVLPDFDAHPDFSFEDLPRGLMETFYESSRKAVGVAPLMLSERHLLSLGKLARRLGRPSDAEANLRAALASPGTRLFHAEDAFHLGMTLIDLGRFDDARTELARAWEAPVFRPSILSARATIAEREGRLSDALESLAEQRRLQPTNVGLCLRFSDVARRLKAFDRAEEALKWASVIAPEDPAPKVALARLYAETGRRVQAERLIAEAQARGANSAEVLELEKALELDRP